MKALRLPRNRKVSTGANAMKIRANQEFKVTFVLLSLSLGSLAACGAEEEPTTAVSEAALVPITAQCSVRGPDAVAVRNSGATLISPTTYGTSACPKAWIADTTPPPQNITEAFVMTWTDPWARNRTQCAGGTLKLDLMTKGPGETLFRSEGTFEVPLMWDVPLQRCDYGTIIVEHDRPCCDPADESWFVVTYREGTLTPGQGQNGQLSFQNIRSFNGRTLRFVARALTPAGSTQSVKLQLSQ
jgi:hypothetical protein